MARFPAFLDTCSIFPAYLCDTLLRLAEAGTYPGITVTALRAQAKSYRSPAMTIEDLLGRLAAAGVPRFASEARRHL